MPRILFLASAYAVHTTRWVNAIVNRGYEVHLVSLAPARNPLDTRIFYYQAPLSPQWGYFANFLWVRRLIARIKPDLVHAHYVSGYGMLATLAGFHPTILSVWGSDVYVVPNRSLLHKHLLKFYLAKADKILSTSHTMAKETSKYTNKPIEVTPFGVDLDQFKPQPVESPFDDPTDIIIGTVKTLDKTYGIEYLIRAFRLLKDKYPNLPLKLLIVGSGPLETSLNNLVSALGLVRDTLFTGHVKYADVPKYHNMLSVSVSVSVDVESFGVAVVEASACGKPVIVSNVGGLPEIVEDGVSGFIVPPRNPQKIVEAIEKLLLDETLSIKMGKAGRERVKTLFNWDDNVKQMTKIYDEILSSE